VPVVGKVVRGLVDAEMAWELIVYDLLVVDEARLVEVMALDGGGGFAESGSSSQGSFLRRGLPFLVHNKFSFQSNLVWS
jgi:hypothetical protein